MASEQPGRRTVYSDDPGVALRVARGVGRRATGNFLVAQLTCLALLSADEPVDVSAPRWWEQLPDEVGAAFDAYLDRRFADRASALRDLLAASAFSEGTGCLTGRCGWQRSTGWPAGDTSAATSTGCSTPPPAT
jgi:hypothetical protein